MNITNLIEKLHNDYNNLDNRINNTLRYQFKYNTYLTDVLYTEMDGLEQTLRLIVRVDDLDYLIVEYFSRCEDTYTMQTYIDPEIYERIKFSVLLVNGKCKTNPYFEAMKEQLLVNNPIVQPNPPRNYYHHQDEEYKPFFETTIRKHMSPQMRDRILKCYSTDLARRILFFCDNTQTLRFTTDENRAKNIEAYLDNHD